MALAPAAFAQNRTGSADEAETAFQLGNDAFLAGQFRDALGHYFVSNRLVPNRNVVLNIARCFESMNDFVESYRYFQEYVALAPPGDKDVPTVNDALARLANRVALIAVSSDPTGATVYLNRKDLGAVGTTPRVVPVLPGTHNIILEREGYRDFTSDVVTVTVGKRALIDGKLRPLTAILDIRGEPGGASATWLVDGQALAEGSVPGQLAVTAGRHLLRVVAPGHEPYEVAIDIAPDETRVVPYKLTAQTGTVLIGADEVGALIRIDGQPSGFTPAVLDAVVIGRHELEVVLEVTSSTTSTTARPILPRTSSLAWAGSSASSSCADRARRSTGRARSSAS